MPPKKILVVEDEADWQKRIRERVEGMGYEVALAGSVIEARTKILASPQDYGLILLDLQLTEAGDDKEGLVLLDQLREQDVLAPCVIQSAHLDKALLKDIINNIGKYKVVAALEKTDFVNPAFVTEQLRKAESKILRPELNSRTDKMTKEALWPFILALVGFPIVVFAILTVVVVTIPSNLLAVVVGAGITLVVLLIVSLALFVNKLTGEQFVKIVKRLLAREETGV
jgi:CheY-like chemotaxis protein